MASLEYRPEGVESCRPLANHLDILDLQNFLPEDRSNRAAGRNYVAVGNAANYVIAHTDYTKSEITKLQ